MKTYSGELKDGMPCKCEFFNGGGFFIYSNGCENKVHQVYTLNKETGDNEWQLYKPQPKKVWGIPEAGQSFYTVMQKVHHTGDFMVKEWKNNNCEIVKPSFLSKEHAEQHAKALNMRDEFRLLSDVPVDDKWQYAIDSYGDIDEVFDIETKSKYAILGVVFDTYEQAEQALVKFPQIHIANKILQFGFHGIVEERL